ncbi:MAG: T9SS type A sorting domain-containing protein [Bacteroidales bacterium]
MKKQLLVIMLLILTGAIYAQETLTGWNFPANTGKDSLNANLGLTANKAYDLRFQWVLTATTDSTVNTVTFATGATTYAAATSGWANGSDVKFWSIKFKANNYTDFKVSSKQKSDANGPRDFKLQWRLSSGTYADVTGGAVTTGSDWTTGVLNNVSVPITGQGTSSIYLRWIMASNTSVGGGTVEAAGQSMVDDILVTGVNSTGQNEILYTNRLKVYPSPNHGKFTLSSTEPMDFMSVTDVNGKTVVSIAQPSQKQSVEMQGARPGLYILKVRFSGSDRDCSTQFVVE